MQTFRFHFRKITLTAFMMFAVASLGWIVSCNKEQTKPELTEQQKFEEYTAFKQPCTPEDLQQLCLLVKDKPECIKGGCDCRCDVVNIPDIIIR